MYLFISGSGSVCLVKSQEDGQWYRGVSLQKDLTEEDKTEIFFADFGCKVSSF